MDINYLLIHHDELLTYLREHDYAETYVNRYKTTIKQITDNASNHNWTTYEDVTMVCRSELQPNLSS